MNFNDTETTSCDLSTTWEVKIDNFLTSDIVSTEDQIKTIEKWEFKLCFTVYNELDDWLVVFLGVTDNLLLPQCNITHMCTLSIIDADGNRNLSQSFTFRNFLQAKYLKHSFIGNKADELLPGGALTLRVDVFCTFGWERSFLKGDKWAMKSSSYPDLEWMSPTVPSVVCSRMKIKRQNENLADFPFRKIQVFDYSYSVLFLPRMHELRRRFGVLGFDPPRWRRFFPSSPEINLESITDFVWIFDTEPDRFLLSLGGRGTSDVGSKLLEASSVIRLCVDVPMREQVEKRIKLKIASSTFQALLESLRSRELMVANFDELVDLYRACHLYDMKDLQKKCAERMVTKFRLPCFVDEMKEIASMHLDEYLQNLLNLHCGGIPIAEQRPGFECYV